MTARGRDKRGGERGQILAMMVISLIALTLAAIVLLRSLSASRAHRLNLEARQKHLYAAESADTDEEPE